jgi:hypothetical protein
LKSLLKSRLQVGRVPVLVSRNNRHFPAAMLRSLVPELQSNWGEANARLNLVAAAREPGALRRIQRNPSDMTKSANNISWVWHGARQEMALE